MRRKFWRGLGAAACLLAAAVFCCLPAGAAVYTAPGDVGNENTVYVAGEPNSFPLEYYNSETKSFCGAIPDMLKAVSNKTGISFTYIAASTQNRQQELSQNSQVELVTALLANQEDCVVTELIPVLTVTLNGHSETYCVGVTKMASPELVQQLKTAFSAFSEREKLGFLLANAQQNPAVRTQSRTLKIVLIAAVALLLAGGLVTLIVVKKKRRNAPSALVDEKTGVGNAQYYTYAFEQLLSRQSKNLYAVLYLAANAEEIAAKHGEKAVLEVERLAAAHLNAAVASAEYLARVSPGIFVLLVQAPTQKECLNRTQAVVSSVNRYVQEFYPDLSNAFTAGVSRLCEHPDCNAETAFYNAKQGYLAALRGGTSAELTSESNLAQSKKQEKLRQAVLNAVENGEFRVYLQLITESQSKKICGAEVLSRWQNREYGLLRPHEYIEILKQTGQIAVHDYKMFAAACELLQGWNKAPYSHLFLSCNFTRDSLSRQNFFKEIEKIASAYSFNHARLIIEITEDSIAENLTTISQNIKQCRKAGFKIAIDDMGTGFSSFADLYNNEIDLVKMGGEFVAACALPRQRTVLSDMVALVHHSGAKILCEGVENLGQAEFLNQIHCDMLQGFYFSKILPKAECQRFLKAEAIFNGPVFKN